MLSIEKDGIIYRFINHLYAVSRCGKALRKLSEATPTVRKDGYLELGRIGLMHRAVAKCWLENPTGAKLIHHKNHDKTDNRADNLEWVTQKEHAKHHSDWKTPYVRTPETIAKFVASKTGVKDNEAARIKKKARLLTIVPRTACKYKGVTYPSIAEAARVAGIHQTTFRVRCLSKNFPEYEIVRLYYNVRSDSLSYG